jgi:hypothetical protein
VSEDHIGEPVLRMIEKVRQYLAMGRKVRIVTARCAPEGRTDEEISHIHNVIEDWCERHIGVRLPVTCSKDYGCVEIHDDRAVQIVPNTGMTVEEYMIASGWRPPAGHLEADVNT